MKKFATLLATVLVIFVHSGCAVVAAKKGAEVIAGKNKSSSDTTCIQIEEQPKTYVVNYNQNQ